MIRINKATINPNKYKCPETFMDLTNNVIIGIILTMNFAYLQKFQYYYNE